MAGWVQITDESDAIAWVKAQDHQTRVWFACRDALRVLPGLGPWRGSTSYGYAIASLRATLISGAMATCPPASKNALIPAAAAAKTAADDVSHRAKTADRTIFHAVLAARAAAQTASDQTFVPDFQLPMLSATGRSARAPQDYSAITFDANHPKDWPKLWPESEMPSAMESDWSGLKRRWNEDDADWSFWIDWYERILNGTPMDWDLVFQIATGVTDTEWEGGQAIVGPKVAEICAAHQVELLAKDIAGSAYLAQPGTPGMGHNAPPSLIDDDVSAKAPETLIWIAAGTLRDEARSDTPGKSNVQKAVGVLIAALQASGLWVAQKVDKAITDAAGAFGRTFGAATGVSGLAYVTGHSDKIIQLVDKVLSWLSFIG